MTYRIFVDMDGVLSDFDTAYIDAFGFHPRDCPKEQNREVWNSFINMEGFYHLAPMPDTWDLVRYLQGLPKSCKISILSSTSDIDSFIEVQRQKMDWLKAHGFSWPAIIVPGKRYKKGFAVIEDAVLIDDTAANVLDWEEMGKFAVHHSNAKDTITKLEGYLSK